MNGNSGAITGMLDRAAVLQWVYEPARLNGVPIEVESTVTINFTLR